MKLLNFKRVLCLAPHPDDIEYSMAGAVMKHPDTHFDLLCLTQGGDCDLTTGVGRTQEVKNAWTKSNTSNFSLYFSEFRLLKDLGVDEWINYIERNYTSLIDYDCIITSSEIDSHFEHTVVASLAAPLARKKPLSIMQYKSPSTLEAWTPNLFISLGDLYTTKKEMLLEFKSQIHHPYFSENVLDGFHTNFQCMKKGMGYVELYKVITAYE